MRRQLSPFYFAREVWHSRSVNDKVRNGCMSALHLALADSPVTNDIRDGAEPGLLTAGVLPKPQMRCHASQAALSRFDLWSTRYGNESDSRWRFSSS